MRSALIQRAETRLGGALAPRASGAFSDDLSWRVWRPDVAAARGVESVFAAVPLKGNPPGAGSLARSVVAQGGLGAVGGTAWETFARSGVAMLVGTDPDTYGDDSVTTQPMLWRHRGHWKAWVQGRKASRINPAAHVCAAVGCVENLPLYLLRAATVLVVAGDSEDLLLWAARIGAALAKPVVQGAVHGETGTAIVRGFALRDSAAACPRCGQGPRVRFSTAVGCDPSAMRRRGQSPTRTLPAVTALAGQLLAAEALKWCTESDALALRGEEITYSLWTHRVLRTELPRRGDCQFAHESWLLDDLPGSTRDTTLDTLAARLGLAADALLVRGEIPWVSAADCAACGRRVPVGRFARWGAVVGVCPCGTDLTAGPSGMRSIIPREDLAGARDRSLEELGLGPDRAIGLLDGEKWFFFFPPVATTWPLARRHDAAPEVAP